MLLICSLAEGIGPFCNCCYLISRREENCSTTSPYLSPKALAHALPEWPHTKADDHPLHSQPQMDIGPLVRNISAAHKQTNENKIASSTGC